MNVFGTQVNRNVLYVAAAGAAGFVAWSWFQQGTGGSGGTDEAEFLVPEEPTGVLPFGGTQGGTFTEGPVQFRDDREWYQAALDKITLEYGLIDTPVAANALDRYLASTPLTAVQVPMINFVINTIGPPPSGARQIRQETQVPGGTTNPPTVTKSQLSVASDPQRNSIRFRWNRINGANHYVVWPELGGRRLPQKAIRGQMWWWTGLKPDRPYAVTVVAIGRDGREISNRNREVTRTKR